MLFSIGHSALYGFEQFRGVEALAVFEDDLYVSMSSMRLDGSPRTMTRSAFLPGARLPICLSRPR